MPHLYRKSTILFSLILFAASPNAAFAQSVDAAKASDDPACARLAQLALPAASITLAQTVAAGTFAGPPAAFTGRDLSAFYKNLPAFCRVVAVAKPSSDSEIKLEVWMPLAVSGWNGKLQGIGNGGFAGVIDYLQMGAAMKKGYAATATDTGHAGSAIDAAWALGHPEKVADFGHRGIHEMTRVAKAAVHAFYGKDAQRSYFVGCSDGGREALMEAQRYPADYDGILAGAPANYWTTLLSTAVADTQALTLDPASFIPPAKIPAIGAAVVAACDALDDVRDGILNDPRQCHFDPASIQCKAGEDSEKCLTAPQAAALKKIYDGPHDEHVRAMMPGYLPGAEDGQGGWGLWITLKAAEEKTASALNASDPDLRPFKARGGKLIVYHGWNDPAISALNTVNYYDSVIAKMGQRDVDSFARFYMVPGMQHCDGGPGADSFGQVGRLADSDPQHSVHAALEQWVEKGVAPSTIIATKYGTGEQEQQVKMTRPLCAYPRAAKYQGSGDTNDAANFTCEAEKK